MLDTIDFTKCTPARYAARDNPRCIVWSLDLTAVATATGNTFGLTYPQHGPAVIGPENTLNFVTEIATRFGVFDITRASFSKISSQRLSTTSTKKYSSSVYVASATVIYLVPKNIGKLG